MARKTSKPRIPAAARIAERAMKGWRARSGGAPAQDAGATSVKADAVMPSLDDLRRKYLGDAPMAPGTTVREMDAADAADPTDIVTVESGSHSKVVGVRGGKVKWQQG